MRDPGYYILVLTPNTRRIPETMVGIGSSWGTLLVLLGSRYHYYVPRVPNQPTLFAGALPSSGVRVVLKSMSASVSEIFQETRLSHS